MISWSSDIGKVTFSHKLTTTRAMHPVHQPIIVTTIVSIPLNISVHGHISIFIYLFFYTSHLRYQRMVWQHQENLFFLHSYEPR